MQRDYQIVFDTNSAIPAAAQINALAAALQLLHQHGQQAQQVVGNVGQQMGQAQPQAASFLESMLAFRAVNEVFSLGKDALKAYAAEMEAIRDYARETAEENLKLRDVLREFKFIRGDKGGGESEDVLKLALQTGMRPSEAGKFAKAFADAQAAMPEGEKASPRAAEAMLKEGGTLVAAADMDPTATAKMMGLFGRVGAGKDPDKAVNTLGMVSKALGVKSMADFKQMAPYFFGMINEMVGEDQQTGQKNRITNIEDAAALFSSATTVFGGRSQVAQSATGIRQASRMLRRFGGETGEFLKEIGVTPEMGLIDALRKIAPVARRGDADVFLHDKGFANSTEVQSVMKLARALPAAEEGFEQNAKDRISGKAGRDLVRRNADFRTNDMAGLNRIAETQEAVTRHIQGKQTEALAVARKAAEAELVGTGAILPDGKAKGEDFLNDRINLNTGGTSARDMAIDRRVFGGLVDARRKVGLGGDFNDIQSAMAQPEQDRGRLMNEMILQIGALPGGKEALGDVFSSREVLGKFDELIQAVRAGKDNPLGIPGVPAAPAAPRARPVRAGGP